MTFPTINKAQLDPSPENLRKWLVVALVLVVAFVALLMSRRLIEPLDVLLTRQMCTEYGRDVESRELVDVETSNRFSLTDRRHGVCVLGPVVEFDEDGEVIEADVSTEVAADGAADPDGEVEPADAAVGGEELTVSIRDIETPPFYRGVKWLFIIIQLGAASAVVRLTLDPLLDRLVRIPRARRVARQASR